MKAILVIFTVLLCACSSSSKISEYQSISNQPGKSLGLVDLTDELSRLPGVLVRGDGRLARITFNCGSNPSFFLNGQVEPNYAYVYDMVKASKLKSVRILNLSDALVYGVRGQNGNIIVVETVN